ncbi:MAG: hypothetical protein ABR915_07385 [Thermoguttaceae bacterium]
MKHSARWLVSLLLAVAGFAAGGPEVARCQPPPSGPAAPTGAVRLDVQAGRALVEKGGRMLQPVRVTLRREGAGTDATVRLADSPAESLRLTGNAQTIELLAPAVSVATDETVTVEIGGKAAASQRVTLKPVRKLVIYILPHSHTDIGYTAIQTDIEKKQVNNLLEGIRIARRTASYPEGARFVWNVEVLWAADLYLKRLDERQKAEFVEAVKAGQVFLNGMYLNELTGLCRPEELIRLFRLATRLAEATGKPIDSAMISDVPAYTWGVVPAMAQAGIRYFSVGPNGGERIGTVLRQWENKPFYWVGPDGKSKVLAWIPLAGYTLSIGYKSMTPQLIDKISEAVEKRGCPYDVAYIRWAGHGDNAVPDPTICDFVKDWNARYAWPRLVISGTSEAFRALEDRYGKDLPRVRGDWTPYWEDGAGSSALETAMNRRTSDRLAQAEALWAIRNPAPFPSDGFDAAWNNVLLYSEHTWGADCSVTKPESQKTREQWAIKQGYALEADKQSKALLGLAMAAGGGLPETSAVDVFNTLSWPRTAAVTIPAVLSAGDRVVDDAGRPVPSERLASGELLLVAKDVPPLAARRYTLSAGAAHVETKAVADGAVLENGLVRVRVDEKTGGIVELAAAGIDGNFADATGGQSLNEYLYLPGDDLKDLKPSGPSTVRPGERGPLLASLVIDSDAPGCRKLRREVRCVAGLDYVEILDLADKTRLEAQSYVSKAGKESVQFGFPFHVPGGQIVLDIPLGMMRPEADQMPGACKNWLTAGRFADVSNRQRGVTWVTLDAPLVEIGGITATLVNQQADPSAWRKTIEPTQKLYSWVMNNHWYTNYRAYQEGPVLFRFALRPHGKADLAEASRFALGLSQPLLAVPARGAKPAAPLFRISSADVLMIGLKPADDATAWIVRLFNVADEDRAVTLSRGDARPAALWLSGTSERRGAPVDGPIPIPAHGLVTVRAGM